MRDHLRLIAVRLRTAPGTALWLALLVLVTSCGAATLPRAVDAYQDAALRELVAGTSVRERSISGSALPPTFDGLRETTELVGPAKLDQVAALFQRAIRPPLRTGPDDTVYGVRNREATETPTSGLPQPTPGHHPQVTLVSQQGELTDHARLLRGRAPRAHIETGGGSTRVEAAVTRETAERMRLEVGGSFVLRSPSGDIEIVVSGVVEPRKPDSPYWNLEPDLRSPTKRTVPPRIPGDAIRHYWHFTALLHRETAEITLRLPGGAELYWHHLTDPEALAAHQIPTVQRHLTSLTTGADITALEKRAGVGPLQVTTPLAELLNSYEKQRAAVAPIVLIATLAGGAVAVIVLLMAVTLTGEHRRHELDLLRSRGGSLTTLAALVLAETALIVLPATVLGVLLALEFEPWGPSGRTGPAVGLALAVAALATLAPAVRAMVVHRRPLGSAGRRDLVRGRPSRRRTVAELTLLVLVAAAVWTLRRTGSGPDADSPSDAFLAATPLLLALAAALLLLRLYPLPLRLLARYTARRRGPVAFLGLAQAGRSPAATGLPLTALLMAVTVASFGAAVLTGVSDARERAALTDVGADARIAVASERSEAASGDAPLALPDALTERVTGVPGVREALPARVDSGATLADLTASTTAFDLVVVDPVRYARLADRTGLGEFRAEELRGRPDEADLPALVSPGLAAELGDAGTVSTLEVDLPVRPVRTLTETPAVPGGGEFVVLPADPVHRLLAAWGLADAAMQNENVLLVTASDRDGAAIDGDALRSTVRRDAPLATVTLRAERRAHYGDSTLQSGAGDLYRGAVGAAAGFSVLALLLSLLQSGAGHRRLLAQLRALGLGRGPAQRLIVVELLPQYLVAVCGGALVAWGSVALLRPGVDLAALAGTGSAGAGDPVELGVSVQALGVPALAVLAVGWVALLLYSWRLSRRGQPNDLRTVDS